MMTNVKRRALQTGLVLAITAGTVLGGGTADAAERYEFGVNGRVVTRTVTVDSGYWSYGWIQTGRGETWGRRWIPWITQEKEPRVRDSRGRELGSIDEDWKPVDVHEWKFAVRDHKTKVTAFGDYERGVTACSKKDMNRKAYPYKKPLKTIYGPVIPIRNYTGIRKQWINNYLYVPEHKYWEHREVVEYRQWQNSHANDPLFANDSHYSPVSVYWSNVDYRTYRNFREFVDGQASYRDPEHWMIYKTINTKWKAEVIAICAADLAQKDRRQWMFRHL